MKIYFACLLCFFIAVAADARVMPIAPPVATGQNVKVGAVVKDCLDCPPMVAIPQVGHDASNPGKIFYAARHELTWREYYVAVREAHCPVPGPEFGQSFENLALSNDDSYPLDKLSWNKFACYLAWINAKSGHKYRIPNRAEWLHLAFAGAKTRYPWGDTLGYNNAAVRNHFDEALGRRSSIPDTDPRKDFLIGHYVIPVEQFKPNNWGIYDVAGNAMEYIDEPGPLNPICVERNGPQKCKTIGVTGGQIYLVPKQVIKGVDILAIAEKIMMTDVVHASVLDDYRFGFRLVRE